MTLFLYGGNGINSSLRGLLPSGSRKIRIYVSMTSSNVLGIHVSTLRMQLHTEPIKNCRCGLLSAQFALCRNAPGFVWSISPPQSECPPRTSALKSCKGIICTIIRPPRSFVPRLQLILVLEVLMYTYTSVDLQTPSYPHTDLGTVDETTDECFLYTEVVSGYTLGTLCTSLESPPPPTPPPPTPTPPRYGANVLHQEDGHILLFNGIFTIFVRQAASIIKCNRTTVLRNTASLGDFAWVRPPLYLNIIILVADAELASGAGEREQVSQPRGRRPYTL